MHTFEIDFFFTFQLNCVHLAIVLHLQDIFQIEDPYRSPTKFWQFCHFLPAAEVDVLSEEYVMLQSYLNMLKVIQNTNGGQEDLKFQIKVKAVVDEDVVQKVNR